jgi:hypothetical protein
MYVPPGWTAAESEGGRLNVSQDGGDGWLEIIRVDVQTGSTWGVVYAPGMSSQAVLDAILLAAREDGVFDTPYPVTTRLGMAWATQGYYEPFQDTLYLAVISLTEQALVIVGHGGDDAETWATTLAPIYEGIVQSLEAP